MSGSNNCFVNSTPDFGPFSEDQAVQNLYVYTVWPLVACGTICNMLLFVTVRKPSLRNTTTSVYLQALAVCDIVALYSGLLITWMQYAIDLDINNLHVWACRIRKFVMFASADTSKYLIVAITFDRFIALCFPLRAQHGMICTRKHAVIISWMMMFLGIVLNNYHLYTRGQEVLCTGGRLVVKNCRTPEYFMKVFEKNIRPWMALTFAYVIPMVLITVFNVIIIIKIHRHKHRLSMNARPLSVMKELQPQRKVSILSQTSTTTISEKMQRIVLSLVLSYTFIALITPGFIFFIGEQVWDLSTPELKAQYRLQSAVGTFVFQASFCCNLFWFCISGHKFRHELAKLLHLQKFCKFLRRTLCMGQYDKFGIRHSERMDMSPDHVGSLKPLARDSYLHSAFENGSQ